MIPLNQEGAAASKLRHPMLKSQMTMPAQTPVAIPKPKNLNSWGKAPEVGRAVTCIPKSSQTRRFKLLYQKQGEQGGW